MTGSGVSRSLDVAVRLALLSGLWWVLVEGELRGLAVAALVVVLTLFASLRTAPDVRWRLPLGAVFRFVPYFLLESLRGGLDVALRAMRPRLALEPGFVEHRLSLVRGPARLFFINTLSLLPGTLSARLTEVEAGSETDDDLLHLHVLDVSVFRTSRVVEMEARVAALFRGPRDGQ